MDAGLNMKLFNNLMDKVNDMPTRDEIDRDHCQVNRAAEDIVQGQVDQLAMTSAAAIATAAAQIWGEQTEWVESVFPTLPRHLDEAAVNAVANILETHAESVRAWARSGIGDVVQAIIEGIRPQINEAVLAEVISFFEARAEEARRYMRPELCTRLAVE